MLIHVDELVIAYSHQSMLTSFIVNVEKRFKVTQSDSLQKTLDLQVERTRDEGLFMYHQAFRTRIARIAMKYCASPVL